MSFSFKFHDATTSYHGSKILQPVAESIGMPVDQVNFFSAQVAAFALANVYRRWFHYDQVSYTTRHLALLIPGIVLGYFAFGYQIWNLLILSMLCYIIILTCNPASMQHVVLFISILYLSYLHLIRQLNGNETYVVDISVPSMIAVQKLSSLGYHLSDGLTKKPCELTPEQQRFSVRKVPTLLELISFIFQFPTLLAGPMFYYNDYIDFVTGEHHLKHEKKLEVGKKEPSPAIHIMKKLTVSMGFVLLMLVLEPQFPLSRLSDEKFLQNSTMLTLVLHILMVTTCARFKYYHAWKFGESISLMSGFGFNGYTEAGEERWDYINSVDIVGFEIATSFRKALSSWNITTQNWLKQIAYDRVPKLKTLSTYLLSAVWHGFYPGYYMTFLSGALITEAARAGRRHMRPHFIHNKFIHVVYDMITLIATKLVMAYVVLPFVLLEFTPSYLVYKRLYFVGHVVLIAFLLTVNRILPKRKDHNKNPEHVVHAATVIEQSK